nr:MAG TPA: Cytochrome oxidase maturation protein cbb3-type [Caudoviricetes sp.]
MGRGERIKWAKKSRQFKNLEDAVAFRNEVILGAE